MTATAHSMTVGDLVGKILGEGNPDFLKQTLMTPVGQFMTVEVDHLVGAGKHEQADGLSRFGLIGSSAISVITTNDKDRHSGQTTRLG